MDALIVASFILGAGFFTNEKTREEARAQYERGYYERVHAGSSR